MRPTVDVPALLISAAVEQAGWGLSSGGAGYRARVGECTGCDRLAFFFFYSFKLCPLEAPLNEVAENRSRPCL